MCSTIYIFSLVLFSLQTYADSDVHTLQKTERKRVTRQSTLWTRFLLPLRPISNQIQSNMIKYNNANNTDNKCCHSQQLHNSLKMLFGRQFHVVPMQTDRSAGQHSIGTGGRTATEIVVFVAKTYKERNILGMRNSLETEKSAKREQRWRGPPNSPPPDSHSPNPSHELLLNPVGDRK